MIFPFIFQSILLSLGVATDAFVVATANGINHTKLNKSKILVISILFGLFQGLMPLIGYFVGNIIFSKISYLIPSVSLCILSYLGIKMILSSKIRLIPVAITIVEIALRPSGIAATARAAAFKSAVNVTTANGSVVLKF